jgi:RNA polymerase sigma-54 factor
VSFALEMAMAPRFGLEVSPALVLFSEMLTLPCAAMQAVVENELSANAALERLDAEGCPICQGKWRTRCSVCSPPTPRPINSFADVADRAATEPDISALRRSVRMETSADDTPIVECLIDSLDEHGLLDQTCAQIATELGVAESVVARVLDVIRRCGPPGIGATGIIECLLLQLDALDLDDASQLLARAVITDHLPALARGHFTSIASALGVSRAEIKQVLDLIRRQLRPYPAFDGNAPALPPYVVPDLVVREHDEIAGTFTVELVEPAMTRLGVRQVPRRKGSPTPDAAEASVPRAKSFLAQLHDRWDTLRRIAEYTVERQQGFFVDGATALKPLTRTEVAAALELHESTVSRAVADKYALLPDRTIVPLARFFGVSGGIDGELRKLVESADGPMSDQRLADGLREAGYPIARRTVAKHRARLGITAAPMR